MNKIIGCIAVLTASLLPCLALADKPAHTSSETMRLYATAWGSWSDGNCSHTHVSINASSEEYEFKSFYNTGAKSFPIVADVHVTVLDVCAGSSTRYDGYVQAGDSAAVEFDHNTNYATMRSIVEVRNELSGDVMVVAFDIALARDPDGSRGSSKTTSSWRDADGDTGKSTYGDEWLDALANGTINIGGVLIAPEYGRLGEGDSTYRGKYMSGPYPAKG